ncbi:MAG: hypothetical protein ACERKD_05660 [Prolixibacteraceae bacterium]
MRQKINKGVLIGLLFSINSLYGQINHQVSFNKNYSIELNELGDGNFYNQLIVPGLSFIDSLGGIPLCLLNTSTY